MPFIMKANTADQFRRHISAWLTTMVTMKRAEAGRANRVARRKECTAQSETYDAVKSFIDAVEIQPVAPATYHVRAMRDALHFAARTIPNQPFCGELRAYADSVPPAELLVFFGKLQEQFLQVPASEPPIENETHTSVTYAIRVDHYADNENEWAAYTILKTGFRHTFFSGQKEVVDAHATALRKLPSFTIGLLVGEERA